MPLAERNLFPKEAESSHSSNPSPAFLRGEETLPTFFGSCQKLSKRGGWWVESFRKGTLISGGGLK